jgi:YidC/Oxa1 family membrane protein insertase
MSREQRFLFFISASLIIVFGWPYVAEKMGWAPKPVPKAVADAKKAGAEGKKNPLEAEKDAAKKPLDPAKADHPVGDDKAAADAKSDKLSGDPKAPAPVVKADAPKDQPGAKKDEEAELIEPDQLVLGSLAEKTKQGYQLQVQIEQKGAGVASIASSRYDAEFVDGRPRKRPLQLIEPDPLAPASFSLIWVAPEKKAAPAQDDKQTDDDEADSATTLDSDRIPLDFQVWKVVRDAKGRVVHPLEVVDDKTGVKREGQEIVLRLAVEKLGLEIQKTFRLWKGENGFELDLAIQSAQDQKIVYKLMGPHGIPIEGEWYTSTFRDVCFGQIKGSGVEIVGRSAAEVVKGSDVRQTVPLAFSGVEDQYFAILMKPLVEGERWDAETEAIVVHERKSEPHKADVSFALLAKPTPVGPNQPVAHRYAIFAGPKTKTALAPFGAEGLSLYRKGWTVFGAAPFMAGYVITPLLENIYAITAKISRLFGGTEGNYGFAIILLTMTVRMILFPLGRKQAIAAKKMQDLQPLISEIREKYKDDKEKVGRETMKLYGEQGVNPLAGCLPALIQLPIFIGLWQALNSTVELRHAQFLPFFIRDLAAPDMLFRLPFEIPYLGHFFNLLPFVVMGLMLVQTKLFSPPPTTDEAAQQQKVMKFMMIFMAFMFYKVPSGLGLYFITSSLWGIGERLLLPKIAAQALAAKKNDESDSRDDRPKLADSPRPGANGVVKVQNPANGQAGPGGWFSRYFNQILEEAAKQETIRNDPKDKNREKSRGRRG